MAAHGGAAAPATFPTLVSAILKGLPLVLAIAFAAGILVYLAGGMVTQKFASEAQILVEVQNSVYTRPTAEEKAPGDSQSVIDEAAIKSQVQLLLSYDLGEAVVKKLNLEKDAEFDPLLKGQGLVSRILMALDLKRDPSRLTPVERAVESYMSDLTVYQEGESRVITVRFRSAEPQTAARVVNTLVDEYLQVQREAKQATTRDATAWLSGQIDTLRSKVETAEQAVADFRANSGLLVGQNNTTLNAQQLSELNSQLIVAQTQRSEAQARAQSIRTMLASGRALDQSSEVLDSPLLGRLQERLISLRSQRAELLATLLPQHPRITEIDAEIAGLNTQIRSEMNKIASSLENSADVAGAREASIRANLEALKAQVSDTSEREVQLRALEREAKAQRDLLEALLARFREASARQDPDAALPDARVISRPVASNMPAAPERGVLIVAAMVMATLIGLGIIAMRHLMRYAASGLADGDIAGYSGDNWAPPASVVEPVRSEPVMASMPPAPVQYDFSDEDEGADYDPGYAGDGDYGDAFPDMAAAAPEPAPKPVRAAPAVRDPIPADLRTDPFFAAEALEAAYGTESSVIHTGEAMRAAVIEASGQGRKHTLVAAPRANGVARPVAMALARSLAKDGMHVVVVDVNDTDQSSHQSRPGLRALLSGRARFVHVIQRDDTSTAHVILADKGPSVISLADSERFTLVLDSLAQTYDAVILAASPVATSAETVKLAARVDQAIVIAVEDLTRTDRETARARLADAGCPKVLTYVPGEDNASRVAARPNTAAA
ncbi:MAG: hypothetical protein KDJ77_07760 [Rhodobiaceae bacterium]|nr:hypothetical protein [Rhodobiaceae bacterium]